MCIKLFRLDYLIHIVAFNSRRENFLNRKDKVLI